MKPVALTTLAAVCASVFAGAPASAQATLDRAETSGFDLEEILGARETVPMSGLITFAFGALIFALLASLLRRLRNRLGPRGILPTTLAVAHLLAKLVALSLAVLFFLSLLPTRAGLMFLLALAGLAVAVGWSIRDVIPDFLAGLILTFERRVRRGMWISSATFSGQVEQVGLRASILRDERGSELLVPNRELLRAPLASDPHREREKDVTLRIDATWDAELVRMSISDAVLSSPWAAPGQRPLVFRDPDEPWLWRVRARLLEPRFGVQFEGELLERTEAILKRAATDRPALSSANAASLPPTQKLP